MEPVTSAATAERDARSERTVASASRLEWSPARLYLVTSAVFLLVTGTAGFIINHSFPFGASEVDAAGSAHIFGIFETNGWHNLAAVLSGIAALGFAARAEWAPAGALIKGGIYVVVTVSVAFWGGETFWIASNAADQMVHATLAVGGIVTGLLTRRSRAR